MSSDSGRQIKQMVNFIMQEAHEKVNEIRIKVLMLIIAHERTVDVIRTQFTHRSIIIDNSKFIINYISVTDGSRLQLGKAESCAQR